MLRFLPIFLSLLSCCLAGVVSAGPVTLKRVWLDYRAEDSFVRLNEYFTGEEYQGQEPVIRSSTGQRSGQYWLIRTENSGPSVVATVELKVIAPDSTEVRSFDQLGQITLHPGEQVFHVGLTHEAWKEPAFRPVAWQLRLLDPSGQELARQASFLW